MTAPWTRTAQEILTGAGVTLERGLTTADARARLSIAGKNRLRVARRIPALAIFVNQLRSVLVVLLLAASALSFAVGDMLEGIAIGAAIALTVALGFATELRALRSMEALRKLGAVRARVVRDGISRMIAADELVPGDVVLVEGGDRVTADLRVIEASRLQADESALTGESVPVGKRPAALPADAPLAERRNMLYKGATVTRGAGAGVVVATGMSTELGRIAALVDEASDEATPLERRLAALGRKLLWICLAVAAVTSIAGIVRGRAPMLMIETGIALAVAAVPEGLPVVATIALARGLWRLSARHALIRRLSAVETLGATSVIVADKTGTLTENRMSVVALDVDDTAYELDTEITRDGQPLDGGDIDAAPGLRAALEIGVLCNNASLAGEGADDAGDPLEVALLRAGALAGLHRGGLLARWPELREVAFDPDVKMMATVHRADDGVRVAVKGAPEVVLASSIARRTAAGDQPLTDEHRHALAHRGEAMASAGLRVLAVAERTAPAPMDDRDVYAGLTFVGFVGLADPPRREVAAPIAACRRAGIRVVMATGDQPATAASIARAVGLARGDTVTVVHGSELAGLGELASIEPARRRALREAEVFARVTPEQKLDIIALHQEAGAVVAMTGDGVNDAPALRSADIGVAMGMRGTDVAREAAAMVLVDDSFDSIVAAVAQGRAIFENIRRFVVYLLSCNVSEILVVAGAVLVGAPLPLLPLQILFLNLVTDVFPALALGFGEGDPHAMSRPPRDAREPIVGRRQWAAIGGYAALLTASVLGAMALALSLGHGPAEARSVSFLTLGFAQLWHVFNMRGSASGLVRNDIVRSPWVWGALALCSALLAAAAFTPPLAHVLAVAPLPASAWVVIAGMSLVPWLVGQLVLAVQSARLTGERRIG